RRARPRRASRGAGRAGCGASPTTQGPPRGSRSPRAHPRDEGAAGRDPSGLRSGRFVPVGSGRGRCYAAPAVRIPITLYALALIVRVVLFALFPDPAYPDSYYYVDVARALAAGHGLNLDFIWIFAEVGNHIPATPTLPIPGNAHWLPLASFLQAPFIAVLGPTPVASAIPTLLIGSITAPLTW